MISKLHEKLKSKKISSLEITQSLLKKVKSDSTNSYILVCENEAIESAKRADERIQKNGFLSKLDGVPLGIKDILCTKGIETTCASKILKGYVPPYDATSIALLKKTGMVMLGKLNMDEFAMGSTNENSAYGAVKNPVNPQYVPGGSSGGSSAAVKAGLAFATLGTDTGGSIRLPASYTGIVGIKPTYGLVSRYGLVAFASSLDQIGPMANTVEDCSIVLSEIAAHDPMDSTSIPTIQKIDYASEVKKQESRKFKIGIPKEYFVEGGLQSEVAQAVENVRKALEKAGHKVVEVSLPHTPYSVAVYYILAVSEASSNLARFDGVRFGARQASEEGLVSMYKKTRSLFGEEVKRRILLGTFALSSGYYDAYYRKACQVRRLIKNDFDSAFKDVDVILGPVSPTTAFKIGEKINDPLKMYLNDILTIPANLAGLPGISVPAGRDANGLPIGVQFIGNTLSEVDVLSCASFVEKNVYREPEVDYGI
ncbi:MAG: Asp-tRNA(Asn)/Glu-tRNA(Gln) amidotransferase subunit GatA [Bacteriovoracia bacterium]